MKLPFLCAALAVALAGSALATPVITLQPSPPANVVSVGTTLTNRVTATSMDPPLLYQWMWNDADLPGATNAVLILTNVQAKDTGSYVCRVADLNGTTNSR